MSDFDPKKGEFGLGNGINEYNDHEEQEKREQRERTDRKPAPISHEPPAHGGGSVKRDTGK